MKENRKLMKIGAPYIFNDKNYVCMNSDISIDGTIKTIGYRVDKCYENYLSFERSDAFVLALLYFAMIENYDIEWDTPCSSQLIFQLTTYYIPILSTEVPFFNNIHLSGKTIDECLNSEKKVATAISGGVDSTYTLYNFLNTEFENNRLSHVLFTDCFINGFSEKYKKEFYDFYLSDLPKQASELNLEFVFVSFNLDEHFSIEPFRDKERGIINDYGLYTLKYCSIAYALSKLISIFYFSSGQPAHDFSWISKDTDSYDLFTMPMISCNEMTFYSSGSESTRTQKVKEIADWEFAQKHLQVCAMKHDNNCGCCNKCIRTMSELYLLDKLDLFHDRFPVKDYLNHLGKRWGYLRWQAHTGHLDEIQLLEEMRLAGKSIKKSSFLWLIYYALVDTLKFLLRGNKLAYTIYRKYNLGTIVYGNTYKQNEKLR